MTTLPPVEGRGGSDMRPDADRSALVWIWPLAATIAIQTSSSFLSRIVPTVAPVVTSDTGLSEEAIGYMSSLGTVGSMLFLAAGTPLIRRFGPIRTLQVGLLVSCMGLALLVSPVWWMVLIANFVLGLGYGPSAPAGSDVLLRHAPAGHRTLIFSLKQAGVPLGGVLSGLLLPYLMDRMEWRMALLVAACLPVVTVLLVQPVRARVDAGRDPTQPIGGRHLSSPANLLAPLRTAMASPVLRRLSLAAMCFSIGQGTVIAFLVTYMVQRLGFDLVAAGVAFAALQATGVAGRVLLGWLADRIGSGLLVLRLNAIAMGLTLVALALSGPGWSYGALLVLSGIAGITVTSWNGVQLAEVARLSPRGQVSESTAGASLVTFLGYVLGPAVYAAVLSLTDSYALCFALVGATAIVASAALWGLERADVPNG